MKSKPWLARAAQWGERQNLHMPSRAPTPLQPPPSTAARPRQGTCVKACMLLRRARFPFDTKKIGANVSSNPQPRVLLRRTGVTLKLLSQAKDFVEFMNPTLASSCNSCTRVLTPTESSGGARVHTRPREWRMQGSKLWLREHNLF